jgi:hypothetical protein
MTIKIVVDHDLSIINALRFCAAATLGADEQLGLQWVNRVERQFSAA